MNSNSSTSSSVQDAREIPLRLRNEPVTEKKLTKRERRAWRKNGRSRQLNEEEQEEFCSQLTEVCARAESVSNEELETIFMRGLSRTTSQWMRMNLPTFLSASRDPVSLVLRLWALEFAEGKWNVPFRFYLLDLLSPKMHGMRTTHKNAVLLRPLPTITEEHEQIAARLFEGWLFHGERTYIIRREIECLVKVFNIPLTERIKSHVFHTYVEIHLREGGQPEKAVSWIIGFNLYDYVDVKVLLNDLFLSGRIASSIAVLDQFTGDREILKFGAKMLTKYSTSAKVNKFAKRHHITDEEVPQLFWKKCTSMIHWTVKTGHGKDFAMLLCAEDKFNFLRRYAINRLVKFGYHQDAADLISMWHLERDPKLIQSQHAIERALRPSSTRISPRISPFDSDAKSNSHRHLSPRAFDDVDQQPITATTSSPSSSSLSRTEFYRNGTHSDSLPDGDEFEEYLMQTQAALLSRSPLLGVECMDTGATSMDVDIDEMDLDDLEIVTFDENGELPDDVHLDLWPLSVDALRMELGEDDNHERIRNTDVTFTGEHGGDVNPQNGVGNDHQPISIGGSDLPVFCDEKSACVPPESYPFLTFGLDCIVFVDDVHTMRIAAETLLDPQVKHIGLDLEMMPMHLPIKHPPAECQVMQAGTADRAFLFDLNKFEALNMDNLFMRVFGETRAVKLGMGFSDDLGKLAKQFPHALCFKSCVTPFLDFQQILKHLRDRTEGKWHVDASAISAESSLQKDKKRKKRKKIGGLAKIVQYVLRRNMDKFEQVSCWGNRPLRDGQTVYAALDVVVPCWMFDELSKWADVDEFPSLDGFFDDLYPNT